MTLRRALLDKAYRKREGINGALEMTARHAVTIESLRVIKHLLMAASIITYTYGYAQPWMNTATCWILCTSSVLMSVFRKRLEAKVVQGKRDARSQALNEGRNPR